VGGSSGRIGDRRSVSTAVSAVAISSRQIVLLENKSARSSINGHDVTPTLVNGTFRLS
jgi:hypothetical protein